jgi:hypothetical protein
MSRTEARKRIHKLYLAQGLPTTAALVVLARCIVRTAWSIHTYKTTFDAERLSRRGALAGCH